MDESLSKVIGARVRLLRERAGLTQDRVAVEARSLGFPWTSGRVRKIETGENTLTVDSFLAIAIVLSNLTSEPITLATLIDPLELEEREFDGHKMEVYVNSVDLALAERCWTSSVQVAGWFMGEVLNRQGADRDSPPDEAFDNPGNWLYKLIQVAESGHGYWLDDHEPGLAQRRFREVMDRSGAAEMRAARTLGVDAYELAAYSTSLWGIELTHERDRRAAEWEASSGKVASAQKRGQITRELLSELRTAIERDRKRDDEHEARHKDEISQEEAAMRAADESGES